MIVPIILSGGSGTRLWPLSTTERPKQFVPLIGTESLFRQTLRRVADRARYTAPIVIANAAHENLCRAEMGALRDARLILEPVARNTAAAIIMAAEVARQEHGPGALLLVMPSDHMIRDVDRFDEAVSNGVVGARVGRLVTFGIQPRGPETGYGYLESGPAIAMASRIVEVAKFTEKPSRSIAEAMVAGGRHFWNAGIFLFRSSDFLAEAQLHAPDIKAAAVRSIDEAESEGNCIRPSLAALELCPSSSVDYAVMERSSRIAMVPMNADWSDVGSWDVLAEMVPAANDDRLISFVESTNCYVRSDGLRVGLVGVDDLLVVATGDRILIMRRGQSQKVSGLTAPKRHAEASPTAAPASIDG